MLIRLLCFAFCVLPLLSCNKRIDDFSEGEEEYLHIAPFFEMNNWSKLQGGAIFGDMLVCLSALDRGFVPNGIIYDMRNGEKICELSFPTILNGKQYFPPHANQVSFGNIYYDSYSEFPLLYVSQVNGGSGYNDIKGERGVLVYNLKRISEDCFVPELVQAIIPDLKDTVLMNKIGEYTPNYVVDNENNQFVILGYPNDSWYDVSGYQPVVVIDIPPLSKGEEIVFTSNDVIKDYASFDAVVTQQSFCYDGKLFTACGFEGQAAIRVVDLVSRRTECTIDLTRITFGEPQFIGLWRGGFYYYEYNASGQLYYLKIPGYVF